MTAPVVNYSSGGVGKQQFILPAINQADPPMPLDESVRIIARE